MHERILAIDYGEKRMGIAISDPLGLTAQPYPYILNDEQVVTQLQEYVSQYHIKKILIGMPFHTQGGATKTTHIIQAFGETLKACMAIELIYIDERYSTVAATKQLDQAGINRKKQRHIIDSQAAAFILQGYLDKASV